MGRVERFAGERPRRHNAAPHAIMPPLRIRERYLEPAKATLGSDCFQRVCAEGRTMPVAEAASVSSS
jgi:hypothetical protein